MKKPLIAQHGLLVRDENDSTKEVDFNLGKIQTNTKRVVTFPNDNITVSDAGNSSFVNASLATLNLGDMVFTDDGVRIFPAIADSLANCDYKIGVIIEASAPITPNSTCTVRFSRGGGWVTVASNSLVIGKPVFLSVTVPGGVQQNMPTELGQCFVVLGEAVLSNKIEFNAQPAAELV